MKVRIFQLPESDSRIFQPYGTTVEDQGFDFNAYKEVYSCEVPNYLTLDDIFEKFNNEEEMPKDFKGHSLSISDLVELTECGNTTTFYCEPIGWKVIGETDPVVNNERTIILSNDLSDDYDQKLLVRTNAPEYEIMNAIKHKNNVQTFGLYEKNCFKDMEDYMIGKGYLFEELGYLEDFERYCV